MTHWPLPRLSNLQVVLAAIAAVTPLPAGARVVAAIAEAGEVAIVRSGEALPPDPDVAGSGTSLPVDMLTHQVYLNHSNHVAAQLCRSFGFTVWVMATPPDPMPERLLVRVHHPAVMAPDGVPNEDEAFLAYIVNGRIDASFTFDHPWEMQPGVWTFQVERDGQTLASASFDVTPPRPDPAPVPCDGQPTS